MDFTLITDASPALAESSRPLFTLIGQVHLLIKALLPIAVGLALLFFFWGLAVFILRSGDEKAQEEGRRKMIWGVLALFVIVSIWGIIGFFGTLLGIGWGGTGPVPGVDVSVVGGRTQSTSINSSGGGGTIFGGVGDTTLFDGSQGDTFSNSPSGSSANPAPSDIQNLPADQWF